MSASRRLIALAIAFLMIFGCFSTAAYAAAGNERAYTLSEEVVILDDGTPLGAGPDEHSCCILHFLLAMCALGVTLYYTRERRLSQAREFELRSAMW